VKKVPLEIVGLSSSSSQVGHYALILEDVEGRRRLPIIIGGAEAQAIALELESIKTNRPMTHDLIFNLCKHFDLNLTEIVINDLQQGVFYARLVLENDGEVHEVDSRPSDAVAIAVRFKAPIFCAESVLLEAGIEITEEEGEKSFSLAEIEQSDPVEDEPAGAYVSQGADAPDLEALHKRLEEALLKEDYEAAARIRDEIQRKSKRG
jgi:hypothetical protein